MLSEQFCQMQRPDTVVGISGLTSKASFLVLCTKSISGRQLDLPQRYSFSVLAFSESAYWGLFVCLHIVL